ncbi:MAG: CHAP domain-containing protein [Candidatus Saccharibacteria bacterium]|nr:CHAP domain-containing protein [Candidatus Saccharibacteria bacterium]
MKRSIYSLCLASLAILASILPAPRTSAYTQQDLNNVNSKISELRTQMNEYEAQASAFAAEANSIQNEINSLRVQQASLKTQIELKEAERQQLIIEIDTITKRINTNSDTVGYTIAQFYYNDEISTLERMASSDSFSSFIDEEMQMSSISDTLSKIIEENKNLKAELETKKKNAELILKDLDAQRTQLAQLESEQAVLLAQTRESENSYRQLKAGLAAQKAALEEEQQKILTDLARQYNVTGVTAGDPRKGGYPYSNQCPQNKDAFADQWGMYICECVSYTAWKVYSTYGYMPYWGGRGNAKQWPANARAAGYTVSNIPKVGTVGISTGGAYGHAVWVEAVSGNRVYISQYNYRNAATGYRAGEYSEQWVDKGMYQYIYFGK